MASPRRWDISNIFKFMVFIGPISSIFDYATYAVMLFVFDAWSNPSLFQTGWFVELLLTQTLIIHIIRTAKVPFVESCASNALITTTIIICAVGIALPYTWAGSVLGFTPLPTLLAARHNHADDLRYSHTSCESLVRTPMGALMFQPWLTFAQGGADARP